MPNETIQVNAYLSFKGDCEAAFTSYAKHLGGRVGELYRYGGTPLEKDVPDGWQEKIMHGSIAFGDQVLMGGDVAPARYEEPKGVTLSVHIRGATEAERVFAAMADGGKIVTPLAPTFWTARFGMVIDRFGVPWLINGEDDSPRP
jgi:PhnB protein